MRKWIGIQMQKLRIWWLHAERRPAPQLRIVRTGIAGDPARAVARLERAAAKRRRRGARA